MPQLDKPAQKYTQSGRQAWITTLSIAELRLLRDPRPPENLPLFTDTNRPINRRHLSSLESFLLDTPDWALPPMVFSVQPDRAQYHDGRLAVDSADLAILDGQHRVQAIATIHDRLETASLGNSAQENKDRLAAFRSQELSIVVIETSSNTEHRQIFAWFARTRPIEPAVREYFDQSDPYGKAAKTAMEHSTILLDRVDFQHTSLPSRNNTSRHLLTLRNLKDLASVIHAGIGRPPSHSQREAAWNPETQKGLSDALVTFFDTFLPACDPNYAVLDDPTRLTAAIPSSRAQSFALEPPILRLFANAWARWTRDRDQDPEPMARVIGTMNLHKADPGNDLSTRTQVVSSSLKYERVRSPAWEDATRTILKMAEAAKPPD